jgi:hypothetical protein
MRSVAAGTVIAKNYLPFARVLARSFAEHHPGVPFYVLLCDEVQNCFDPAEEPFVLIPFADLDTPHPEGFRFRYSIQYLSIAAKPNLFEHLFGLGYERVLFLDSDILITGDLMALIDPDESSVALTPHLLSPLHGAGRAGRELAIIRAGTFNAGCVSVMNDVRGREFIGWWQKRLRYHTIHDVARGLHGDQRWLDLAGSFFEGVSVIRDPACNVAYWNLPERAVSWHGEQLMVNGLPCRFFHFSGFSPASPTLLTRHIASSESSSPSILQLLEHYANLLLEAGYEESRQWPYAWQTFDNGVRIPDIARNEYRDLGADVGRFGNPFDTSRAGSFFEWLREIEPDEDHPDHRVSRIWDAVYRHRTDVQRAFPDHRGAGYEGFARWTELSGAAEHGIPGAFRIR